MKKLKVMTYNIASGREHGTNQKVINVIPMAEVAKEYAPDILGLNEVRAQLADPAPQLEQIAEHLGYPYSFYSPAIRFKWGEYGNGFVSKYPILKARTILIPDAPERTPGLLWEVLDGIYYETRVLIKATILVEDEKIDVFVTHFGLADNERKNMLEVLKYELAKSTNRCILMGDFNCVPESAEIAELEEILKNAQPQEVDEPFYTYLMKDPRKIDYIMVSKDMDVKSCKAIDSDASDHRPYCVEIEF